jgi:hypothetical protein
LAAGFTSVEAGIDADAEVSRDWLRLMELLKGLLGVCFQTI